MEPTVTSILCFTRRKGEALFLLWRDKKSTLRHSDATFWSGIPAIRDEEDVDEYDTLARTLAEKTNGAFLRFKISGASESDRVLRCREQLLAQLRPRKKTRAALELTIAGHRVWAVAVKYVPVLELQALCSSSGDAEWVAVAPLLRAATSHSASGVKVPRYTDSDKKSNASGDTSPLVLYLPFVAVLRSEGALENVRNIVSRLTKIDLQDMKHEECLSSGAGLSQQASKESDSVERSSMGEAENVADGKNGQIAPSRDERTGSEDQQKEPLLDFVRRLRKSGGYACRKCRQYLFSRDDVVDHGKDGKCTSWFVRKVPTLVTSGGVDEEGCDDFAVVARLLCFKCHQRVGNRNWSGARCSCGRFESPAFQVSKGKVEPRCAARERPRNHTTIVRPAAIPGRRPVGLGIVRPMALPEQ